MAPTISSRRKRSTSLVVRVMSVANREPDEEDYHCQSPGRHAAHGAAEAGEEQGQVTVRRRPGASSYSIRIVCLVRRVVAGPGAEDPRGVGASAVAEEGASGEDDEECR
jgi:hypothetical protein